MTSDFETIEPIATAACGAVGDELAFTYPGVLEVIKLCTLHEIAVLGVEVFVTRPDGYYTESLSTYDQQTSFRRELPISKWMSHVAENNSMAEEFVRLHTVRDGRVYVLTTASWREHCVASQMR